MIDLQSPAIARSSSYRSCHSPSPGGEGRDEGELNRTLTILSFCLHLCASVTLWQKFVFFHAIRVSHPKIPKPVQAFPTLSKAPLEGGGFCQALPTCAKLCQPVPDPSPSTPHSAHFRPVRATYAYLRLLTPPSPHPLFVWLACFRVISTYYNPLQPIT